MMYSPFTDKKEIVINGNYSANDTLFTMPFDGLVFAKTMAPDFPFLIMEIRALYSVSGSFRKYSQTLISNEDGLNPKVEFGTAIYVAAGTPISTMVILTNVVTATFIVTKID